MANNNHFNLTLDTLAPVATIKLVDDKSQVVNYINSNRALTVTRDTDDAVFMKLWFDSEQTGTTSSQGYIDASWVAFNAAPVTAFSTEGNFYYHVALRDDVNNESAIANSAAINFDTTLPTASNVVVKDPDSGSTTITNNRTGNTITFNFVDGGTTPSGVASAKITGVDVVEQIIDLTAATSPYSGTVGFTESAPDGSKTIQVYVTDRAGNVSEVAEATITLDTTLDIPVIVLKTPDGTANLPAYINYVDHKIKIQLTAADTNITGYKIWEGSSAEPEYTEVIEGALDVTVDWTLTEGDGLKTIHAKVKDAAGNEKSAVDATVTVDTVKPVATLTSSRSIISNVTEFATAVLTYTATDALSGIKSWQITCNDSIIASGSEAVSAQTYNFTSAATGIVEGSNTITLTVTDKAENQETATVSVILDTTAPTVSFPQLNAWYTSKFDISVTYADANNVQTLYAWVSKVADDTTLPSGITPITPSVSPQTVPSTAISWMGDAEMQSADDYMHVKAVDVVGNAAYHHCKFGFDNIAPTKPVVAFTETIYTSTTANITISCSDATSGCNKMQVHGDIANPTAADTWEDYGTSRSVTLNSGDGIKKVTVYVKDTAGNISEISNEASCYLDETKPTGTISLYDADGTTPKATHSPVATFAAHAGCSDVGGTVDKFKVYGDFTYGTEPQAQGITEETAVWQDYTPDSGKDYQTILGMVCTSGDGNKKVYIKVKDTAGHESDPVYAEFVYDTTEPTVTVSGVDYNRISKVHLNRRNSSGEIEGKFADETNFVFTPGEVIQAYKVCAYADQAAAIAGSHEDAAIPTTAGSVNMSATGLKSDSPVNSMIKGADFETALGGTGHDGAHIVTVYVQDLAGQWSAAAVFTI